MNMRPLDIFIAVSVALFWGVNFVAVKIGLQQFAPIFMTGLRFLVVTLCVLPFTGFPKIATKHLLYLAIIYGAAYHALLFTGVFWGLDVATSVITVQLNVPFTSLLGVLLLQDRLGWRRISGMVISFAGIAIIVGTPAVLQQLPGFFMAVSAAWCWAFFNIKLKKLPHADILPLLGGISFYSTPLLFGLSFFFEPPQWHLIPSMTVTTFIAVLYTALISTVCGFGMWFYLLKRYSVHQVAPFSMLMPIFGVLASILMLGERLQWQAAIGGIITLIGVTIIVLRRPKNVVEGVIVN